jgi:hypothetical protein
LCKGNENINNVQRSWRFLSCYPYISLFSNFYAVMQMYKKIMKIKLFWYKNIFIRKLVLNMKKNFDMDAAIRRALRESIEAHAHEWEPKIKTGVGPVGDDAPFDDKVNEGCDKEEACCPKCGKEKCECGDMNEGTIPADAHEWEPGFETGVGEVGDDSPFTQAVNEAFVEGGDWEKGSFGASDHEKEGIAFADGGDECQNGVVATSQKNSGEVVSSDNLSESEDDEGFLGGMANLGKAAWNGIKKAGKAIANTYNRGSQAQDIRRDRRERDAAQAKVDAYNQKYGMNQTSAPQQGQGGQQGEQQSPQAQQAPQAAQQAPQAQQAQEPQAAQQGGMSDSISKADLQQWMQNHAGETDKNGAWENLWQFVTGKAQLQESKEEEKDVIAEERDRFFNIINRIEKLYD